MRIYESVAIKFFKEFNQKSNFDSFSTLMKIISLRKYHITRKYLQKKLN